MQSIIFEIETERGFFRDALYFEDDFIPSDIEIEAMKQERLNNWFHAMDNPAPATKPEIKVEDIPEGTQPEIVSIIKKIIEG